MKNKKIMLYLIGNDENFNYYVFDKKQKVMEILSKIFLMDFDITWDLEKPDKKGDYKKVNVKEYTDIHESDGNEKFRINIFFGNKKIFLTINCPESSRLKFNESLFKYAKIPKPNRIKQKMKIKW